MKLQTSEEIHRLGEEVDDLTERERKVLLLPQQYFTCKR